MSEQAIRTIAVAGSGIVGLSTALAFARSLPRAEVRVIEAPQVAGAVTERLPVASPAIARFHAHIGLDEVDLVRCGAAVHHLGTIIENWSGRGQAWVQPFGPHGKPAGGIPFDQVWLCAWKAGQAQPYHAYSAGAALALTGKFVHPAKDPASPLSRFLYGLRLDPRRYAELLRQRATAANIQFIESPIVGATQNCGRLECVALASGETVRADLYVDCTGPAALLIRQLCDGFEDWAGMNPVRLLRFGRRRAGGCTPTAACVRATQFGWTGAWPIGEEELTALASDEDVPEQESRPALGDGSEAVQLCPGRRVRPWVANVLAIGDSAVALDPLNGLNLELAHNQVLLALELLPRSDFAPLELREYNRRAELMALRARDFALLHYLRSCHPGAFWRRSALADAPDSLARTLDQYGHRARIPFDEEEIIGRDSWAAALIGMGVVPRHVPPAAAGVPLDRSVAAMARLATELRSMVARLPSYREYRERMLGAPTVR